MKTFSLVALILLLCSCSAPHYDSTQAVKQFLYLMDDDVHERCESP